MVEVNLEFFCLFLQHSIPKYLQHSISKLTLISNAEVVSITCELFYIFLDRSASRKKRLRRRMFIYGTSCAVGRSIFIFCFFFFFSSSMSMLTSLEPLLNLHPFQDGETNDSLRPSQLELGDFWMTNSVARASKIMADCVRAYNEYKENPHIDESTKYFV